MNTQSRSARLDPSGEYGDAFYDLARACAWDVMPELHDEFDEEYGLPPGRFQAALVAAMRAKLAAAGLDPDAFGEAIEDEARLVLQDEEDAAWIDYAGDGDHDQRAGAMRVIESDRRQVDDPLRRVALALRANRPDMRPQAIRIRGRSRAQRRGACRRRGSRRTSCGTRAGPDDDPELPHEIVRGRP